MRSQGTCDGFEKDGRTPKFSHLMASSFVNYLQDLMHCVKVKFIISGTVEQRLFLQCTVKVCLHLRFCASLDFHAHELRAAAHNAVEARYRGGDVPPTAIGGTSPPKVCMYIYKHRHVCGDVRAAARF